jgi:hypothetical protein
LLLPLQRLDLKAPFRGFAVFAHPAFSKQTFFFVKLLAQIKKLVKNTVTG